MSKFAENATKISDKAKELKMTSKELMSILSDAGYEYTNGNANLKPDAMQYLQIEFESNRPIIKIEDGIENAVIVSVGDKFAVVHVLINSKMEVKEISRKIFESKVRAYFELGYQTELLETGR
jgi:phage antirepressor YoqD-like protein